MKKMWWSDKEMVLGWFMITNKQVLSDLQRLWDERQKDPNAKFKKDTSYYVDAKNAWWQIFSMDPDSVGEWPQENLDVYVPSGLLYDKDKKELFVASDHNIKVIKWGGIIREINHDLFNCLHSLTKEQWNDNLLVTSTGIDTILSMNWENYDNLDWYWNAHENGYDKAPYWKRRVDLNEKHQWKNYPTMWHTTHLNSVINHKEWKLLSTFFQQGELVEIDIKNWETKTILSWLTHPHSIKKKWNEYFLCDTKNWTIIILDEEFNITNRVQTDSKWIQDAELLSDWNILYCDWSNWKIEKITRKWESLDKREFGNTKRIGWIVTLNQQDIFDIFWKDNEE